MQNGETNLTEIKASELITILQKQIDEHGDAPIRYTSGDPVQDSKKYGDACPAAGIITILEDEGTPAYHMVVDSFTFGEMQN